VLSLNALRLRHPGKVEYAHFLILWPVASRMFLDSLLILDGIFLYFFWLFVVLLVFFFKLRKEVKKIAH
jgi:hypothetical protein